VATAERSHRLSTLVVLLAAVACYLPALPGGFVQDDHPAVESSPVVARGSLVEVFSTDYWGALKGNDRSLYRPVTVLSWALERRLVGRPSALFSHAVSVGLHAAATLLLLVLAARMLAFRAALAVALLFAVHPVHVEAVAYIAARADVLAGLFTLAALVAHSHPVEGRLREWARALATAACAFLAVASKEVGIAAPVLLVVFDLIFRPPRRATLRRDGIDRVTGLLPTAFAVLSYLCLRTLVLGGATRIQDINPTDNRLVLLAGGERLGTALGITARYVRLFLAPFGLAADRSGGVVEPDGLFSVRAIAGLVLLAAFALLAVLPWLRAGSRAEAPWPSPARAAAFGAWLFLLPYLPGSNLFFLVRATVAERVLYLPSAGLCVIGGAAACALAARVSRPKILTGVWLGTCALLALLTWRQCGTWRSDETAFSAALRNAPKSPRAAFILGKVRQEQGRHAEALALFEQARTVWPDFIGAWVEAASELARARRFDEAENRLRAAIARLPDYASPYHNLGVILRQEGRIAEAEACLRKATIYDPSLHRAWAELGHLYFDAGRFADAARCYDRAVKLGRADLAPRLREARARVPAT